MRTMNLCSVFGFLLLLQTGCGTGAKSIDKGRSAAPDGPKVNPNESGGHSHEAQHGGIVQAVGDFHLELVHDTKNGELSLYVMGSDENTAHSIEANPFKLQAKLEGREKLVEVEVNPIPLHGEAKGKSSRFAGTAAELIQAKAFEVVVRVPIEGKIYRTAFQFAPAGRLPVYVCAMDCERGKVYYKPGKCPVCKMDLLEPQSAHADHSPKHGGQFFMAPDRWHHIEGVVMAGRELHVYFYNNFTKPISAQLFLDGSFIEVVKLDADKREIGKPMRIAFDKVGDGFLQATLPEEYSFPLGVNARIKFEGQEKPTLFNFTFESGPPGEVNKK